MMAVIYVCAFVLLVIQGSVKRSGRGSLNFPPGLGATNFTRSSWEKFILTLAH